MLLIEQHFPSSLLFLVCVTVLIIGHKGYEDDSYVFEAQKTLPIITGCQKVNVERMNPTDRALFFALKNFLYNVKQQTPKPLDPPEDEVLRKRCRKTIHPDGNCLFRAISYCMFKDESHYQSVRKSIVEHVVQNWDEYQHFILGTGTEIYDREITTALGYNVYMSQDKVWGGEVELTAASRVYNICLQVFKHNYNYRTGDEKNTILALHYSGDGYHGHYDVVEDVPLPGLAEPTPYTSSTIQGGSTVTSIATKADTRIPTSEVTKILEEPLISFETDTPEPSNTWTTFETLPSLDPWKPSTSTSTNPSTTAANIPLVESMDWEPSWKATTSTTADTLGSASNSLAPGLWEPKTPAITHPLQEPSWKATKSSAGGWGSTWSSVPLQEASREATTSTITDTPGKPTTSSPTAWWDSRKKTTSTAIDTPTSWKPSERSPTWKVTSSSRKYFDSSTSPKQPVISEELNWQKLFQERPASPTIPTPSAQPLDSEKKAELTRSSSSLVLSH